MRLLLLVALALATGCGATVRGSPLSSRPGTDGRGVFMTTGNAPRPYRTLGFAQVTGYGVTVAGMSDVGEAGLDGTIRGTLSQVAAEHGRGRRHPHRLHRREPSHRGRARLGLCPRR